MSNKFLYKKRSKKPEELCKLFTKAKNIAYEYCIIKVEIYEIIKKECSKIFLESYENIYRNSMTISCKDH